MRLGTEMVGHLPKYYFRLRENGATVFVVDTKNKNRRIELNQIAVANLRSGEIRPQSGYVLTDEDNAEIENWMAERRSELAARELDDALRTVEQLNRTATWAQQRATENDLERVTDALLLAMHDLRSVLIRKAADTLSGDDDQASDLR